MRWVMITGMYNVADLATEFCAYHLELGVDRIFIAEYGSTDGTLDLLQPLVRSGQVEVVPIPTHHFATHDPSNAILAAIRTEGTADWVSFQDPDEFLTGPDRLKEYFTEERSRGVEATAIPRANLIGIGPLPPATHYLQHLTLKIVGTDMRTSNPSALLSSPWIFSRLPPKVAINAANTLTPTPGDHSVIGSPGSLRPEPSCQILHLPIRSYEAFREKIECAIGYYGKNPEFKTGTGWHWRRWITLHQEGRLREEYAEQFLDPTKAEALRTEGQIVRETRLADWLRNKEGRKNTNHSVTAER
jgi:Glycosyl transferase family 2